MPVSEALLREIKASGAEACFSLDGDTLYLSMSPDWSQEAVVELVSQMHNADPETSCTYLDSIRGTHRFKINPIANRTKED